MDVNEAVKQLVDQIEGRGITPEAAASVYAHLVELEAGEVVTEWGVRWPDEWDDGHVEVESYDDDRGTAAAAARASSGEVVQREVRTWRGPWKRPT